MSCRTHRRCPHSSHLSVSAATPSSQLTPLHLATTLAEDKGDILRQAITGASGSAVAARYLFERALTNVSEKLPLQSLSPESVRVSTTLVEVLRRAQSTQKKSTNLHLAVDQLLLDQLQDSQISDCL